jgi:hypothetical protein
VLSDIWPAILNLLSVRLTYLLAILVLAIAALFLLCCWLGRMPFDFWSISIFSGADLRSLAPHQKVGDRPVITARDVSDTRALFVADPFLWRTATGWHMFFEVYAAATARGVISHATSADGITWKYDRVVLEEPFHLSYPHVFEHDGQVFMTPETGEANEVRLYRAEPFPGTWRLDTVLLKGRYYDPTLLLHAGTWWMWVCDEHYAPLLFCAQDLRGPWAPHACNGQAVPDPHTGRPGGRVLVVDGQILRFAQDSLPTYGSRLHALEVTTLSRNQYQQRAGADSPVLEASGQGWRATGMHHLDGWRTPDGWIAAVDGNQQRQIYNWRAGARNIEKWVKSLLRPSGR